MKQKVFENGNPRDGREILIKIIDDTIYFFYNENYRLHENWVHEETERRNQCVEEELTEEEKHYPEFYWIDKEDWHKSKTQNLDRGDNWHVHMKEKNWFTPLMEKFMDDNSIPF